MSLREVIVPALFLCHLAIILLRQFLSGNDSGATSKVVVSDTRVEVMSGGGLFSSLGVWPLMMGAWLGYWFYVMICSGSTDLPTYLFTSVVAATLGVFACVLACLGISSLCDRQTAVVDRNLDQVVTTRRLIVPLARKQYTLQQFEKITVYPVKVSSGGRGGKTIFKVALVGPVASVDIDCSEILESDVAVRLAEATGRITALPIEVSSNTIVAPDPSWNLVAGGIITMGFAVLFIFVGSYLFVTVADKWDNKPLLQIAVALLFGVLGAGVFFTVSWMCMRELWRRFRRYTTRP